jgi:hypothetical protein
MWVFLAPRNFQGGGAGDASLRRPAFPHPTPTPPYPYAPFWCRYRPQKYCSLGPAGTTFEAPGTGGHRRLYWDVISPPPSPALVTTKAVSAIPNLVSKSLLFPTYSYTCRIHIIIPPRRLPSRGLSTIVARPIIAFHAFVNDAAEAGQDPDITKPWTGICYGIAVPPPMAAELG